jgi:hypothetical protein
MLDGFKFCHRCGKPIHIVVTAPELLRPPPAKEQPAPLPEPQTLWPLTEDGSDEEEISETGTFSTVRIFLIELLCYIPIVNFIVLGIMSASAHDTPLRIYARGKLLAALTVFLILLLAALLIIALLFTGVIDHIHLGIWKP